MSQQPEKVKKTFTHVVQVPPNTDVPQMAGAYRSLLQAVGIRGIEMLDIFPENPHGFTHPIETEQAKLKHDFMLTMQLLQSSVNEHGTVYLENVTFNANSAIFVLYYME